MAVVVVVVVVVDSKGLISADRVMRCRLGQSDSDLRWEMGDGWMRWQIFNRFPKSHQEVQLHVHAGDAGLGSARRRVVAQRTGALLITKTPCQGQSTSGDCYKVGRLHVPNDFTKYQAALI